MNNLEDHTTYGIYDHDTMIAELFCERNNDGTWDVGTTENPVNDGLYGISDANETDAIGYIKDTWLNNIQDKDRWFTAKSIRSIA
jgi:hypothetical protein